MDAAAVAASATGAAGGLRRARGPTPARAGPPCRRGRHPLASGGPTVAVAVAAANVC